MSGYGVNHLRVQVVSFTCSFSHATEQPYLATSLVRSTSIDNLDARLEDCPLQKPSYSLRQR